MPKASRVNQDFIYRHKAAVKSVGQAGAEQCICFEHFLSRVFRKAVLAVEMDESVYLCDRFLLFFFVLFLTNNIGTHLWSALFEMDVSHHNLDYLTEDSTAWFSGLRQCTKGKTGWIWSGILDFRAQDGAFALCRLSMSIKKTCCFFYHVQKASQV